MYSTQYLRVLNKQYLVPGKRMYLELIQSTLMLIIQFKSLILYHTHYLVPLEGVFSGVKHINLLVYSSVGYYRVYTVLVTCTCYLLL